MKTISVLDIKDKERAENIIEEIKGLRKRATAVSLTIDDFAIELARLAGITKEQVLLGLDTENKVINILAQATAGAAESNACGDSVRPTELLAQ